MAATGHPPCTPETARCAFWEWGADALRPQCCTDHLYRMVVLLDALLTREGIHHWLDFGTLLGAVREQAIIPFDYDADFSVLAEDRERILELGAELNAAGHELDMHEDHVWRLFLSKTNRHHVDMFPFYAEGGELRLPGPYRGRSAFPKEWAFRLAPVRLYAHEFLAPAPAEEFLVRYRYGPGYRTPRRSYGAPFDPAYRAVVAYFTKRVTGGTP